jgi:ribonuclease R
MRDKILEIIQKENRRLNPKEILDLIKDNGTVDELRDLIHELDLMCRDGILRTSSGNTYVMNDLLVGVMDAHEKGNGHVIISEMDDVFIPKNHMKNACDKDTVAIEIIDKKRNEGRVVKVLKRSLGRSIGEVINDNGNIYVKCLDDEKLPYTVVVDTGDFNLVEGLLVHLTYVEDISKNRVLARVDSIICHKNAPGKTSEIALIASEFGRRLDFPEEVAEEGRKFKTSLSKEEVEEGLKDGRVDLRGETITTIDGKDTKDIDDAINTIMLPNGNYEETVAIADVSHYVKMGSAIWKFAEFKGNSDYLGNKVGPMLPVGPTLPILP